jgi:hypothetical protein
MLQQIQFHVHEDERQQQNIERALAQEIRENYRLSIRAFERFIPTLADLIKKHDSSVSTLLCNKFGELNIINYNTGQVLYGEHPKQEVLSHYNAYIARTNPISLSSDNEQSVPAMVVMGLGLGYHIEHLISEGRYQHIVVYEPNIDYFVCSLSSLNWRDLLNIAKERSIALYLQIGSDGANFAKDMLELKKHIGVDKLDFYKHLHNPVFNNLESKLMTSDWHELQSWLPARNTSSISESYLHQWAQLKDDKELRSSNLDEERKNNNLVALKKYFPNLYEEFVNYEPQQWAPSANVDGDVYLYHMSTNALFSSAPIDDAKTNFKSFASKPNKDGLLLSYKGKKLKGYLHYQLVEECESVLKDVQEKQSALPTQVKSIIQFGIGSGYGLNYLVKEHDIGMLFICEPNRDFFYASLFAIDWANIISSFDEEKKRLYLNIGDDGSNLTNDLLIQFQSVGPYVLANTFFYQSYVNEKLTDAVAQLREQLLVIIAMGDYFDNAKYGISHTLWALQNKVPFLNKRVKKLLSTEVLDVPVFVVGNGPSLDGLMDTLKEESERAIIISCGTALQALHRQGICPDFHAEIETNRSTFDWLTRVDDHDYLKRITLLSCNGVHPDAAALFGKTLLAFKQGEASTVAFTELRKDHGFTTLNFSYPTVTNFAADIATAIGFNQIYLFGTDMGFVSDSYHHSKSSGYYDSQGNELYDYSANHAMSLAIPGNFKPWVKTKYEFKVSKSVLEQVFASSASEVYNLNDGARILGAKPLKQENVLLVSAPEMKANAKSALHTLAFTSEHNDWFINEFGNRYSTQSLIEELNALTGVVKTTFSTMKDIDEFIMKQRDFIVSSFQRKKSLAFYYLNGTFNYINSMFSKLLNLADEQVATRAANELSAIWERYVEDILTIIADDQYGFDAISSLSGVRRQKIITDEFSKNAIYVNFSPAHRSPVSQLMKLANKGTGKRSRKIMIKWLREDEFSLNESSVINISLNIEQFLNRSIEGVTVLSPGSFENRTDPLQANDASRVDLALIAGLSGLKNVIFLQKYTQHPSLDVEFFTQLTGVGESKSCYSGPDFIVVSDVPLPKEQLVLPSGDRLVYMPRLKAIDLRREFISEEEFAERKEATLSLLAQP